MGIRIEMSVQHSLGRKEAKQRAVARLEEVARTLSVTITWTDNECDFQYGSGTATFAGKLIIKNNAAECIGDVGDGLASQASVIEDRVRTELAQTLA